MSRVCANFNHLSFERTSVLRVPSWFPLGWSCSACLIPSFNGAMSDNNCTSIFQDLLKGSGTCLNPVIMRLNTFFLVTRKVNLNICSLGFLVRDLSRNFLLIPGARENKPHSCRLVEQRGSAQCRKVFPRPPQQETDKNCLNHSPDHLSQIVIPMRLLPVGLVSTRCWHIKHRDARVGLRVGG